MINRSLNQFNQSIHPEGINVQKFPLMCESDSRRKCIPNQLTTFIAFQSKAMKEESNDNVAVNEQKKSSRNDVKHHKPTTRISSTMYFKLPLDPFKPGDLKVNQTNTVISNEVKKSAYLWSVENL